MLAIVAQRGLAKVLQRTQAPIRSTGRSAGAVATKYCTCETGR